MQYKLTAPGHIDTIVNLPASKSISNRALIIHALSCCDASMQQRMNEEATLPHNLSDCDDTQVMIAALRDMPETIDIKAAGTAMRFLTAYLSVTPGTHIITGTERMKNRPIKVLVDALRYLGADIEYLEKEGYPPLRITGKDLEGTHLEIPGNVSSQFTTALLLIGPVLKNGLELELTGDIISRSYIELTLHIMHDMGVKVEWSDVRTITTQHQRYEPRPFTIENDWSAASYWYEIMALLNNLPMTAKGESRDCIRLKGLADGSRQGDSVVRYLFSMLGVKTIFENTEPGVPTTITLKHVPTRIPRLDYNFINQPDLAQTFVVSCACMDVPFHFTGLSTLRIKETDRMDALIKEMRKIGYVIKEKDGCELYWDGEKCEPTMEPIDTYEDHRMALAFAPLCIKFPELRINNPHVVTKSYPNFWNDLKRAGFTIEE
ncbi:MAG: 3-phosphoshikimate 1-carboxyvinyltransferase [Prevotella sp.]|nr:3-phosphoshikimate 1-carboxyvinyltransferase [Prevotella sp.]